MYWWLNQATGISFGSLGTGRPLRYWLYKLRLWAKCCRDEFHDPKSITSSFAKKELVFLFFFVLYCSIRLSCQRPFLGSVASVVEAVASQNVAYGMMDSLLPETLVRRFLVYTTEISRYILKWIPKFKWNTLSCNDCPRNRCRDHFTHQHSVGRSASLNGKQWILTIREKLTVTNLMAFLLLHDFACVVIPRVPC